MYNRDSIDKIEGYLKELDKDYLEVLPSFFQHYACPANCGGCCLNFTKDFLPKEFNKFQKYYPVEASKFHERKKCGLTVFTYAQEEDTLWCDFFKKGKCSIHKLNPFSCSFELNKIRQEKSYGSSISVTNLFKAYYRDTTMRTFQGKKLKCSFGEYTEEDKQRDIKVLETLKEYYYQSRKKLCRNLDAFLEYLKKLPVETMDFETSIIFYKGEIVNLNEKESNS